jgi:polyisoprenoid-binding protein YceI
VGPASPQGPTARVAPPARLGRPFEVVAGESSLVVRVYRAGPLAALGHNHVISCRCITGTLYLPHDPLRGSFDLHVGVDQLTVDDPALRAAEHSADFPPDVPRSARQGTRHNLLGAALLYAARYPRIVLRAEGLRASSDGKPGDLVAEVLMEVRGRSRSVTVPVHYDIEADRIVATGEFSLRQTAIGLTPFSLMAGALRVRDAMAVRFRLVAKRRGP